MLPFIASGVTLGLAAGLSPGPLMALLVAQTVRYGLREGLKVALAPVLTDAPIVTATLLILARVSDINWLLAGISLVGGLYVCWLGAESIRATPAETRAERAAPHSIRRAMGINLLNPHVYVFWATVGAPLVFKAWSAGWMQAAGLVGCFYLLLCGSKAVLAVLVHRSRGFLAGMAYRRTLQALGVVLIGFGGWLLWESARYFSR